MCALSIKLAYTKALWPIGPFKRTLEWEMAYLYLDDSKHHSCGFSISAFAIFEEDPQEELFSMFREEGFDPESFEFKSSHKMAGNLPLQKLRSKLRTYMHHNCRVALSVVNLDKQLGPVSLLLLQKVLNHGSLNGKKHEVFFDQGLFASKQAGANLAASITGLEQCRFNFEQDSKLIAGIQIADLVAHTCSIMLLDALGHIKKKVQDPERYAEDDTIDLGFEMWTTVRYAFLSESKSSSRNHSDLAIANVEPYGLYVDDGVDQIVAGAAFERFGEVYLGCIH